jgi:uncharacterized protein (DUF2062 family)|tara:strand:- start:320 stop:865 length:546 start_codon:yes stop_codon:yes gene_type:complete
VKHRLHRLPDNPEKIARGIWAGVFTTFTPLYGMHFIVAGTLAFVVRGNVLAALLATFFGNPLTYIPIGIISLRTGEFLLGSEGLGQDGENLVSLFLSAFFDLKSNLSSFIFGGPVEWNYLTLFYQDVFFPYLIGGVFPGILIATICWSISLPLIRAYQNRRKGRLREKLREIREKSTKFRK